MYSERGNHGSSLIVTLQNETSINLPTISATLLYQPNMSFNFESKSFAEGRFRRAYKGVWTAPPEMQGRRCVVKELKDTYVWKPTGWDTTIDMYKRAGILAGEFNKSKRPSYPICFTDAKLGIVTQQPNPHGHPKLNEYVVVEDYIQGNYTKWCNNYGYISPDAKSVNITVPAFMHWSWLYTKGQEMVADLQGVRDHNGYHLTDPGLLSISGSYGVTDMGIEGMAMFFLNHECNDICRGWKRPRLDNFRGIIPQPTLIACQQMQYQVNNATTYTFEMKFPPVTKQLVTHVFLQVAQ